MHSNKIHIGDKLLLKSEGKLVYVVNKIGDQIYFRYYNEDGSINRVGNPYRYSSQAFEKV